MTDHRIDLIAVAVYNAEIEDGGDLADQSHGVTDAYRAAAVDMIEQLDAADSAAGYARLNLNDDDMLARLVEAIEMPISYCNQRGVPYLDIPDDQVRDHAIRHALRDPDA